MKTNTPLLKSSRRSRRDSGQALVIIALAFIGIAAFVGLAIDLGILISAQAHLRRAVDSASLAAATQYREGQTIQKIEQFALQFVEMNGLQRTTVTIRTCASAQRPPGCGDAANPRKLIQVEAQMNVRFSFLPIIGLRETTLVADAVAEAASIDMVIVIGTNETMGADTPGYGPDFDPGARIDSSGCNGQAGPEAAKNPNSSAGKCLPLWNAKQAAKVLIRRLTPGSDKVAIVTYSFGAQTIRPLTVITTTDVNAVDSVSPSTGVYADLDGLEVFDATNNSALGGRNFGQFSPINRYCLNSAPNSTDCLEGLNGRNPLGSDAPVPNSTCIGCGIRRAADLLKASGRQESLWIIVFLSDGVANISDLPTTYSGDPALPTARYSGFCPGGLALGGDLNKAWGLWNSPTCRMGGFGDGLTPITITPTIGSPYQTSAQSVANPFLRMCGPYHPSAANCPPGAAYTGPAAITTTLPTTRTIVQDGVLQTISVVPTLTVNVSGQGAWFYSAEDYARDMIDIAALQIRCANASCTPNPLYNSNEIHLTPSSNNRLAGSNITIFSVGLGGQASLVNIAPDYSGARLLRYMAAVGDDGDRVTDPCLESPSNPIPFSARSCGNYFFASSPGDLLPVFEAIANRIFTRLTK